MDAGLIYIQHILFRIKQSGLICARYGAVGVDGIKGGFVSSGACMKVLETGYRRSPPLQPLHLPPRLCDREGASEITSRLCQLMLPSGQEKGSPDCSSFTVVCNKVARAVFGCRQTGHKPRTGQVLELLLAGSDEVKQRACLRCWCVPAEHSPLHGTAGVKMCTSTEGRQIRGAQLDGCSGWR